MKIVITGSKGFIGTHVKKSLQDHDIIEWASNLGKDIRNFTLDKNVDFIIHLAGLTDVRESIQIPDVYWEKNVEYSKKIFDICKNIPMLYA